MRPFVAVFGLRPAADPFPSHRVDIGQRGHPVAGQDPADRARRGPGVFGDPVPALPAAPPQPDHVAFHRSSCPGAMVMRRAGTILQPGLPELPVALDPLVGSRPRDAHLLGHMTDRPTLVTHPINQDLATSNIQRRVTVNHEDLLCLGVSQHHRDQRRSSLLSSRHAVNNLMAYDI